MRDLIRSFFSWNWIPGGNAGTNEPRGSWNASMFQERFQLAGGDGTLSFAAETAERSCTGQAPAIRIEITLQSFIRLDVPSNDRSRPSCSLMLPAPPGSIFCVQELEGAAAAGQDRFSFARCVRGPGDMLRLLEERVASFLGAAKASAGAQGRVVARVSATFEYVKPMPLVAVGEVAERSAQETRRGEIELAEETVEDCGACSKELGMEEWLRAVALGCGHVFHVGCIYDWLRNEHSCALCRSKRLPRSEADERKDPAAVGRVAASHASVDRAVRQMDWKVCGRGGGDDERPKGIWHSLGLCGGSNRFLSQDDH